MGDIVASLQELASLQEAPSVNAMPRKIHHLLQLGYSGVILQEGIHMLVERIGPLLTLSRGMGPWPWCTGCTASVARACLASKLSCKRCEALPQTLATSQLSDSERGGRVEWCV